MDPSTLQECEAKLSNWLGQGYQVFADDIDGELRLTVHFVSPGGSRGSERAQEYWPMCPEVLDLLSTNGIVVCRALCGPRPWSGPHPEEWDEAQD